jgi:PAS domain S-box-containing protein
MDLLRTPFWALPLVTGFGAAILAAYVWTRRAVPGARVLLAALLCLAHWSIASAFEGRSTTLDGRLFWWQVEILGFAAIPISCFLLTRTYVGRPVRRRMAVVLYLVPAAAVLMLWTNDWHHLYWTRIWVDRSGPVPIMGRAYGEGFWVFAAYSYAAMAAGVVQIAAFLIRQHTERRRTLVFLGSVCMPWLANAIYIFDLNPIPYMDLTPYFLAVTGAGMVWVMFRYRFQGIVPVAWTSVVWSMTDGVVVLDMERRVAELNPAAERFLGASREGLLGRLAADAFQDRPDLTPYHASDGELSGDLPFPADGRPGVCTVHATKVMSGKRSVGRVITFRDVTAERQASEHLEQARLAAEAAALAKSRFLASMSHEIRTPMNGVVGATELLLDSELTPQQTDLAQAAQESARCLLSLLNDILDYSKIDAGKLDLEVAPFNVYGLIDGVVAELRPVAHQSGLDLRLAIAPSVPPVIAGDAARLRQVLLNLAGNAIKFTPEGWVSIEVEPLPAESGWTRLSIAIADSGIGIAPERMGTIFQGFSPADSSIARKYGGAGLGLAISRQLTAKMGGTIRVDSEAGRGSTFTVEIAFPVAELRQIPKAGTPPPNNFNLQAFAGCRVLLTEDNAVNQKIGRRMLQRLGCRVDVAGNGREAISLAQSAGYDIVFMDLQMPEVDGLEAAREIRRAGTRTPIVALTASVVNDVRVACQEAGMDAFVTKPIRLEEIASMLQRFATRQPSAANRMPLA